MKQTINTETQFPDNALNFFNKFTLLCGEART